VSAAGTAGPLRVGPWLVVGLIGAIGIANGLLTLLAFGTLGAGWNTLGNSGAVWLLVAFAVGALMPTTGLAIAGATASLVGSVVWFYMAAHYLVGMPVSSAGIAIWLLASVLGGPLYGLAGYWWRIGPGVRHVVGLALVGGVFVAEGVFTLIHDPVLPIVGWVAVGIGALFTMALARSRRDRLLGVVALPVVTGLALVAYTAIYGALALT
jgi:uncharacterized protein DUF6518